MSVRLHVSLALLSSSRDRPPPLHLFSVLLPTLPYSRLHRQTPSSNASPSGLITQKFRSVCTVTRYTSISIVKKAEKLVASAMKGNDGSHNASHAYRVRDLALSLAHEEGLASSPQTIRIVELAALLHDIGDYKYVRDPSEETIVEKFLEDECVEESERTRILNIIKRMGFKEELAQHGEGELSLEFGVVQDADRLDAIGAIGIARCFTFGGSRNRVLHDPNVQPRLDLTKEQYMKKDEQTTINHFHEKLLKLKDLMKTKAGQRRAAKRHKYMEEFLTEFYEEWDGRA